MGRKLDIDTLSKQFERFDFDGSGALDEREYEQLAKSSLLSKEQAARLWSVLDKNDEGGPTDDKVKFVREALYNSVEAYLDGRGNGSGLKICVEDDRPAFGYKWGYKSGGRRLCWGGRDDETTTVVAGESNTLSNVGVVMAIYESDPLKAGCGDGEVKLKLRR